MIFWKEELLKLSKSAKSFEDIYRIFSSYFKDETFSEKYIDGRVERLSYSQFYSLVNCVAYYIDKNFGDNKGGFIAIEMENSPIWSASFFAILMAGFKPLLVNTRLDKKSIELIYEQSKPCCVLCDFESDDKLYVKIEDHIKDIANKEIKNPCWANEIALLSSGTTATPKIIIYDGSAISEQILLSGDIVRLNPTIKNDKTLNIRLIAFLPFYHIFGLISTFLWFIFFGRTFIFLSKYDSESISFACKYNKATHFFAIPLVWDTVAAKITAQAKEQGKYDTLLKAVKLSNNLQTVFPKFGRWFARNVLFKDVRKLALGETLKFCISGGGYIKDDTLVLLNGLGYALHNGYGMTETGILSVELSQRAKYRIKQGVGKPFPTVDYKIEDGVLLVRGSTLYTALYKDGKYINVDKSEYFSTNDMFTVSKSGRWNIIGRKGDIIIGSNGENISPDLIEQRIFISFAKSFCVIGLKDSKNDERPVLILQLSSQSEFERANALESAFESIEALPVGMRPYKVYFTYDEIPKNLGKTKRNLLKENIQNGTVRLFEGERPTKEHLQEVVDESFLKTVSAVKKVIALTAKKDVGEISDNTHTIYDLGFDSMSYYDLVAKMSDEFGIEIEMSAQNPMFTPLDFASYITKKKASENND